VRNAAKPIIVQSAGRQRGPGTRPSGKTIGSVTISAITGYHVQR
jgi:hypothetical protein